MTNTAKVALPAPADELYWFPSPQSYELERTYRLNGEVVRVRVHRDSYERQCWGAVHLLSTEKTWTPLTSADRAVVAAAPSPYSEVDIAGALGGIADGLLVRGAAILGFAL